MPAVLWFFSFPRPCETTMLEHAEYLAPLAGGLIAGVGVLGRKETHKRLGSKKHVVSVVNGNDVVFYATSVLLAVGGLVSHIAKTSSNGAITKTALLVLATCACLWSSVLVYGFGRWSRHDWFGFVLLWSYVTSCCMLVQGSI
jgi:hypothetical protein